MNSLKRLRFTPNFVVFENIKINLLFVRTYFSLFAVHGKKFYYCNNLLILPFK